MSTLRPCPFCGSSDVTPAEGAHFKVNMIHCLGCHATVSFGGRECAQGSVAAWNMRAAVDSDALAETQRAIIEAAERRGYELGHQDGVRDGIKRGPL